MIKPSPIENAGTLSALLVAAPAGHGVALPISRGLHPHGRALLVFDICRVVDLVRQDYPDLRVGLRIGDEIEEVAEGDASDLMFLLYAGEPSKDT